jgi:hypothetical protein
VTAVRRVGRYEILRVIGRGGMATVYLARQRELDRDVALKELTLAQGPEPAVARRFLREAKLAGSFSHPNIVTVHDYFERGGTPYIAMEYLQRGALRPYVGRLSLEQVGGVLEDLLAGLAHAGGRGIVHRDLKPENLMVTDQGRTKIADFGIAKATSTAQTMNLTTAGTTLGTPRYMAPERALGQEVGPWSDLYSVGVIAFELLVGRTPFHDTEEPMAVLMRQINDPIPRVDALTEGIDPAIADWVERLVVKAPEDRTRAAKTALDELDEVLIEQLGPRWTRAAPLPARPGGVTTAAATGGHVAPSRKAAPRRAAAVPLADEAVTVAPATVVPARSRRDRRRRLLPVLGVVIAVIFAAGRVLGGGVSGAPTSALDNLVPPAVKRQADPSSTKTPAQRAKSARAVAAGYERDAAELDQSDLGDLSLKSRMQRVADAYRKAADAVRREDGSDYDDALEEARAGQRAIARIQSGERSSGVGDSQSDDPSDDAPDSDED